MGHPRGLTYSAKDGVFIVRIKHKCGHYGKYTMHYEWNIEPMLKPTISQDCYCCTENIPATSKRQKPRHDQEAAKRNRRKWIKDLSIN